MEIPPVSSVKTADTERGDGIPCSRLLGIMEVILVIFLTFCLIGLGIFLGVWVLSGLGREIHFRLVATLRELDMNWKLGLLLLIPLFFRPVFKFLWNLRKGPLGTESGDPLPASAEQRQGYPQNTHQV